MPLEQETGSRAETERNFDDFRHGKTFRKTSRKFGRGTARKQMIAAVLENKRKAERKAKSRRKKKHRSSRRH